MVDGKEVPYFEDAFTVVHAVNLRAMHARTNTAPIVIVHIRLSSLSDAGSPAMVTYAMLQSYFITNSADLKYIDAPYAFDDMDDAAEYRNALDEKLKFLDRLVGLTTRMMSLC